MIYCVLLNWNNSRDTVACIESLLGVVGEFRLVVCDNKSSDNSFCIIERFISNSNEVAIRGGYEIHPNGVPENSESGKKWVSLIQTGGNLGYAGGNNVGVRYAMRDPTFSGVWILNNDTLVMSDTLQALVRASGSLHDGTVIGSVMVDMGDNSVVQMAGGKLSRLLGIPFKIGKGKSLDELPDLACVDYVSGASLYVPKKVIDEIGLMDERYFLYWEETDYCFRLAETMNVKPVCARASVVLHAEGARPGRRTELQVKLDSMNTMRFYKRFFPWLLPVVFFTKPIVNIFSFFRNGDFVLRWVVLQFLWQINGILVRESASSRKILAD